MKNKIIALSKEDKLDTWDNLILIFGSTLSELKAFDKDSNFLDYVLIPAIREPLTQTLNWLQEYGGELAPGLSKEQKGSFAERLNEGIKINDDDNMKIKLSGIASAFGVDLPNDEEDKEDGEGSEPAQ